MQRREKRTEAEWQTVISELQALKRKLHSKSEALLIISKDLEATRKERDQYKLMAEKLRVRCQAYKRQFTDYPLTKDQASLIQMLRDTKNQKIAHQKQSEVLQQKLNEALGDVKLLRERFARQRVGDEGVGPRHFPAHEREELVSQLEDARQQAEHFRQELNITNDQIAELMSEKDELKQKSERLNNELNFMLNGDKKRIIDIDALCMENKYLQERAKQFQEEKNSLHAQMSKLKAVLNARKASSADIKPGKIRNSGLVISPKQVKEILMNRAGLPTSAETVSDIQSIAAALLETINDKNLALHHLRNTNKILGKRVAELELKLKTLEVAGLWTLTGQSRRSPSSSTPKIEQPTSNLSPTTGNEEEFFSNLGSRLSNLADVCEKSFKEHKLVSLTPESSSSASDVPGLYEETIGNNDVTKEPYNDITEDSFNSTNGNAPEFEVGAASDSFELDAMKNSSFDLEDVINRGPSDALNDPVQVEQVPKTRDSFNHMGSRDVPKTQERLSLPNNFSNAAECENSPTEAEAKHKPIKRISHTDSSNAIDLNQADMSALSAPSSARAELVVAGITHPKENMADLTGTTTDTDEILTNMISADDPNQGALSTKSEPSSDTEATGISETEDKRAFLTSSATDEGEILMDTRSAVEPNQNDISVRSESSSDTEGPVATGISQSEDKEFSSASLTTDKGIILVNTRGASEPNHNDVSDPWSDERLVATSFPLSEEESATLASSIESNGAGFDCGDS